MHLPEPSPAALRAAAKAAGAALLPEAGEPPSEIAETAQRIADVLGGADDDLRSVELDLDSTSDFARSVYEAARTIGPGHVATYGEVARLAGLDPTRHARAVGRALGANPVPVIVPCHRVTAADGRLGGFSASGGTATKVRMLRAEARGDAVSVAPAYDIDTALDELSAADPALGALIESVGRGGPRLRPIGTTVSALSEAIVSQQLHGRAAASIFARLCTLFPRPLDGPTAEGLLALDDEALRGVGLSASKLAALRDLAGRSLAGEIPDLATLATMNDQAVVAALTPVRGIGRWTVEMLLIFRLGRPDVLPVDDFGVRNGLARLDGRTSVTPASWRREARPGVRGAAWPRGTSGELPTWRKGRPTAPKPYDARVLLALLCAFGTTFAYGSATVLQSIGARRAEQTDALDLRLMVRLAHQGPYMAGLALDVVGAACTIVALRRLPLFVVQAAIAGSLAVTALGAAKVFRTRLAPQEWGAIAAVGVGLVLVAASAGPDAPPVTTTAARIVLLGALGAVALLAVPAARIVDARGAGVLGALAGAAFGIGNTALRVIPSFDPGHLFTNPATLVAVGGALLGLLLFATSLQTRRGHGGHGGLGRGRDPAPRALRHPRARRATAPGLGIGRRCGLRGDGGRGAGAGALRGAPVVSGPIERLSAVTLVVRDMARSVAFYEALGFERLFGGPDEAFTSYGVAGSYLNLQLADSDVAGGDDVEGPVWGRSIWWVDDVDALHARVLAAGYDAEFPPADAPWGERYFHVRDPDGHELSFARPLPGRD